MQLPISCVKQHSENDCWICCSVMIHNYLFPSAAMDYSEGYIPELIQKYMEEQGISGDVPASTVDFLFSIDKLDVPMDTRRLPTFAKIVRKIDSGSPLLCLVKDTPGGKKPDPACKDGHWIVICGYLATRSAGKLLILDPDPEVSDLVSVPYDGTTYVYRGGMYFQNTTCLPAPD